MVAHGNRPYPRPWAHILGQRHNAAVEAIISIHDDNVAEKVVEAEAAAASQPEEAPAAKCEGPQALEVAM